MLKTTDIDFNIDKFKAQLQRLERKIAKLERVKTITTDTVIYQNGLLFLTSLLDPNLKISINYDEKCSTTYHRIDINFLIEDQQDKYLFYLFDHGAENIILIQDNNFQLNYTLFKMLYLNKAVISNFHYNNIISHTKKIMCDLIGRGCVFKLSNHLQYNKYIPEDFLKFCSLM